MSAGWTAKRFWKEATAEGCEGGFTVKLDGRAVKTPAKTPLVVPSLAMAQAIAAEWDAQVAKVRPETMPFTRAANSALDKVTTQFDEVAGLLAAYGASDLLCYRAAHPSGLTARQVSAWDPVLEWAVVALDVPLKTTTGIVHIEQPHQSLARLTAKVHAFTPFELAAVHDLIAISGSLILALAVTEGFKTPKEIWDLSRIDEVWQAEHWGSDDEASESEAVRYEGLLQAGRFFMLCA